MSKNFGKFSGCFRMVFVKERDKWFLALVNVLMRIITLSFFGFTLLLWDLFILQFYDGDTVAAKKYASVTCNRFPVSFVILIRLRNIVQFEKSKSYRVSILISLRKLISTFLQKK